MSGAYQDHFARELSPHTPLSPASGTSATNFRANVNRQRSKKWVEAKKVDYGGDDWGDEYDDEPYDTTPPPSAKPTGLRQPGQGVQSSAASGEPNKKAYGELPALPGASQQRSITGPALHRANSFDKDDERRAFSSGSPAQDSPAQQPTTSPRNGPATRFSQMGPMTGVLSAKSIPTLQLSTQPPVLTGISKTELPPLPRETSFGRESDIAQTPLTAATTSSKYSDDYQNRQDYSPSAAPPPLSTVTSPVQNPYESQGAMFPPRKSSLSQIRGREMSSQEPQSAIEPGPKPWADDRTSSPVGAGRARSGSTPAKALPFIRPADIYKRMEEEREKERRSSESGRPNLDSVLGGRPANRSVSPANRSLRERSSSESFSRGPRPKGSVEGFSESPNRRLMPLESVQERKSEYGFDGFNLNDHQTAATVTHQDDSTEDITPQITTTDEHGLPLKSSSPQLPDVGRVSEFGPDFFAQTRPHDSGQDFDAEHSDQASQASADHTLKSQPSLGFRSAVHEAFDRGEPVTPINGNDSGVRRSDSESTGTTGISPIMSRVPSAATAESKAREIEARQEATPAIPEVEEPTSQRNSRAISPPPINTDGPARTPDIAVVAGAPRSTEGQISEASAIPSSANSTGESLSRPAVGREQSFRPHLPGGWISYAGSEATTLPEENYASRAPSRLSETSIPNHQPSTSPEHPVDDSNQTPTLGGHEFSPSASDETAGVTLGSAAGAAVALHDQNESMPTPDASMAPTGNPYSSPLDPRFFGGDAAAELPAELPGELSPEARPEMSGRNLSAVSSAGPTPPPKDTPTINIKDTDSGYFPPPVPLKQRTLDEVAANEQLEPPRRPQVLPTLSTDTGPQDDENDKLRKEIVKSLSPRSSNAHEHRYGDDLSLHSPASTPGGELRDSAYLPSEYDNYWAVQADDENPMQLHHPLEARDSLVPAISHEVPSDGETPPIPPLSTRRISKQIDPEPGLIVSQYTWDADKESVVVDENRPTDENLDELQPRPLRTPEKRVSFAATPDSQIMHLEETREAYFDHAGIDPHGPHELESPDHRSEAVEPSFQDPQEPKTLSSESPITSSAVLAGGGAALAGVGLYAANQTRDDHLLQQRSSLAELKSSTPTLSESEHPAYSEHNPEMALLQETSTNNSGPNSQHSKITPFKDILAMGDYDQRIRTYDSTRDQFAAMNTGLTDWLAYLKAQHPEHADNNGSYGGNGVNYTTAPSSVRSKFSKTIGITSAQAPGQQPYYQQYLNASPASSVPSTPSKAGSGSVGSQQHHLVGGPKMSSQQVQAKSKELLHTAGVFGGKASNIGKGLFAKGKSRFRSGGGDKTSQPTPPTQPAGRERRSSWALPLGFSRSTARPGNAPQSMNAKEVTTPTSQRSRRLSDAPSKYDGAVSAQKTKSRSSSIDSAQLFNSRSVDFLRENTPNHRADELNDLDGNLDDDLAGPVPISKEQPSWDPFNATPIAEEEGYFDSHVQNPGYFDTDNQHPIEADMPLSEAQLLERQSTVSDQSASVQAQVGIDEFELEGKDVKEDPVEKVVESHTDFYNGWEEEPAAVNEHEINNDRTEHHDLEDESYVAAAITSHNILGSDNDASKSLPEPPSQSQDTGEHQGHESTILLDKKLMPPPQHVRTVSDPPMMYSDALKPSAEYVRDDIDIPGVTDQKRKQPELVQHPASFGLPPVRRNSAFGFAFRSKSKSKKRFPIDDDSEEEKEEKIIAGATYVPDGQQWEPVNWSGEGDGAGDDDAKAHVIDGLAGQQVNGRSDDPSTPVMKTAALNNAHISPRTNNRGGPAELPGTELNNSRQYGTLNDTVQAGEGLERSRKQHSSTPLDFGRGLSGKSTEQSAPSQLQVPVREPPSSAQKFPDLFRPRAGEELLADQEVPRQYPAPLTRDAVMLPRQQATEYMLPGVGPPEGPNKLLTRSRRSSSFIKGFSGRLSRNTSRDRGSRATSRDRAGLNSRDGPKPAPGNAPTAQNVDQQASRPPTPSSDAYRGRRRSSLSLLNVLSRTSTPDPTSMSQRSSTSRPVSRDMLLNNEPKTIVTAQEGRKKLNKAARQSAPPTPTIPHVEPHVTEAKKKRFSGLTTFLSRRGSAHRPRLNSTASSTITENEIHTMAPAQSSPKPKEAKPRRTLTKPPPMGENRSRRNSTVQAIPPIEVSSFVTHQSPVQPFRHGSVGNRHGSVGNRNGSVGNRHGSVGNRHAVKGEPHYETPPIPQAYDLVHGDGNALSPTGYDPRGINARRASLSQTWSHQSNGVAPGNFYPPARPRAQYFDPNIYDPLSIAHGSPAENQYGSAEGNPEYFEQKNSPPRRQNSYHVPLFRPQERDLSNLSMTGAGEYDDAEKERSFSRLSGRSLSNRSLSTRSYTGRSSYEMAGPRGRGSSPSPARGQAVPMGRPDGYANGQVQGMGHGQPMGVAMGVPPYERSDSNMSSPSRRRDSLDVVRENVVAQPPPRMSMGPGIGMGVPRQQVGFQGYAAWERGLNGPGVNGGGMGQRPWSGGRDGPYNGGNREWTRGGGAFVAGPAVPRNDWGA